MQCSFSALSDDTNVVTVAQLSKLCQDKNFGVNANNNAESIEDIWRLIVAFSNRPQMDQDAVWALMEKMLVVVREHLQKMSKNPIYSRTPTKNVVVEGMPVSGMSVEDVKDPEVRKKYESALKENDQAIQNLRYRTGVAQFYNRMLYQADRCVDSHPIRSKSQEERKALLKKLRAMVSDPTIVGGGAGE